MISTVTTATVSTIASTTVVFAASLGLLALLIQKELVTAVPGSRAKTLGQILNVAIFPLLMVFALIVVTRLAEIL